MGANPPRLDLETRRGPPLVLEFVSFEIYTSLDKNYGLFPETLTNRRRVDRHSSRYWRINLSWWCFYTKTEYVCCPGFQVLRFQEWEDDDRERDDNMYNCTNETSRKNCLSILSIVSLVEIGAETEDGIKKKFPWNGNGKSKGPNRYQILGHQSSAIETFLEATGEVGFCGCLWSQQYAPSASLFTYPRKPQLYSLRILLLAWPCALDRPTAAENCFRKRLCNSTTNINKITAKVRIIAFFFFFKIKKK